MFKRLRPGRPSPAMIVAIIALVFAFGGTSVADEAVDFAKTKLINGKRLKGRSVSGGKLKRNTIGGTEVNESKLAKVPSASNADKAKSADSATTATSATNASNATNATTADTATTASSLGTLASGNTEVGVYEFVGRRRSRITRSHFRSRYRPPQRRTTSRSRSPRASRMQPGACGIEGVHPGLSFTPTNIVATLIRLRCWCDHRRCCT